MTLFVILIMIVFVVWLRWLLKLLALPFKLARGKPVDPMARAMSRPAKLAKLAREDVQAILARDASDDD